MENTKLYGRRRLFGAFLFVAVASMSAPANADTWACEVTLCLANPQGPTAAAACVGPIKRLWKHLAYGHAMPRCPQSQSTAADEVRTEQATGEHCPVGYSYWGGRDGKELKCSMQGALTTYRNGQAEKTLWWNEQGETLNEIYAQPQHGSYDQLDNIR